MVHFRGRCAGSPFPLPPLKSCYLFEPSKGGYGYRRSGRDKYGPPTRTEYRLIVENLSSRCSWQDLKVWASSPFREQAGRDSRAGKGLAVCRPRPTENVMGSDV